MVSYAIGIHNEKVFDVHISSILHGVLVGAGSLWQGKNFDNVTKS
jgi:hypothetical protein